MKIAESLDGLESIIKSIGCPSNHVVGIDAQSVL